MLMCLPLIRLIFQKHRYRDSGENRPIRINAEADGALLEKVATPNEKGRLLLLAASDRMRLSARGYHRVFWVARTHADLEGAESIARIHIAEALAFRRIAPDKSLIKARA
jgi:magnesium chelatase family protein